MPKGVYIKSKDLCDRCINSHCSIEQVEGGALSCCDEIRLNTPCPYFAPQRGGEFERE